VRYLLITYSKKQGGQIDEQVSFANKVKPRDLQTCNVIMDFKDQKVMKCVVDGAVVPTSYEKLHEYYGRVYPNVVEQLQLANDPRFDEKK
jgi:hypothetical protein